MLRMLGLLALVASTAGAAAPPAKLVAGAPRLPAEWERITRDVYRTAIETPTVADRPGTNRRLADYLAARLTSAGWTAEDVQVLPYTSKPGVETAALVARWRAADNASAKPILVIGHLDVVEALTSDWTTDPFKLVEREGYFYGRGTSDNKRGVVSATVALMKLRAAGFRPKRDIILFFTGDEETVGRGAELGATEWRRWTEAEYALNTDVGNGAFTKDGQPLGFALQTSEKTYQTYTLRVRNPGGHSSKPRADNAIYELGDALTRLRQHRFAPMLNETTRAYFAARAKQEGDTPLGRAMRAWLANPNDGAAADVIEASEIETGQTRTRCVATRLEAGHADNALPQLAEATVNCRIMPGVEPKLVEQELKAVVGQGVQVVPDEDAGRPTPVSPLRPEIVRAYTDAVRARFPEQVVIPQMSTGATDGLEFRARGIDVYGVDGGWIIAPEDEREHGKDERIPVQSLWDNVRHWEAMVRSLAG